MVSGILSKNIKYSPDIIERMLDLYAEGQTISAICRRKDMPSRSVFRRWCDLYPDIMPRFHALNTLFTDSLVDDTLIIADTAIDPQRARNQITTRQWIASKLNTTKYGDKVQLEVEHKLDLSSLLDSARSRISRLDNAITIDNETQAIDNQLENNNYTTDILSDSRTFEKENPLGFSILD